MKLPVILSLLVASCLPLTGCDDYGRETTSREIYKLGFRTAQFQEALERCDADPKLIEKHDKVWKDNFDAAAKWLDMEREAITARQDAGRGGLDPEADIGCKLVIDAAKISFAAAERWADRIENEEHCGITSCE